MGTGAFDHVVIAARSLEEGAEWLRDRLDLIPEPGGRHPLMGTHNMLLSLGPHEYLELIAIDPDAPAPRHPRWYGLDDFDDEPRIAGWVVRQNPLVAPLGTTIREASRGDLRWRIAIPDSGQTPQDGAEPLFIDWGDGAHPAFQLPDHGLRMIALSLPLQEAPIPDPRLRLGHGFSVTLSILDRKIAL
ncbi:VOC family protein [Paracoccus caeni]|uniref:VOC family protein n=1 Tax=Paracoccus caeni TaxID=657651 RepID=A0A934SDV7_9RHOB|nr:VOC family protein [Paracoccus caeni]MBK4215559.1 VOC family protein [Paracoccus caeni]